MKRWIIVLMAASIVNAGRTSAWSETFMLREPPNAARPDALLNTAAERFSLTVLTDPYEKTVTFKLNGIVSSKSFTLRVYGINGRLVEEHSGSAQRGSASVVWKGPAISNGILFAMVRSGNDVKTVRFILFK